jgi:hypothetical protein
VEFRQNPVDFKVTSDEFFDRLRKGQILSAGVKFDTIFIDGLHLAEQVDRDVKNALDFIKDDGFVVMHDCNPPTEWHAREDSICIHTPAVRHWNGTTWKAFLKWRCNESVQSCCIDADWGVGIISKTRSLGNSIPQVNPFFEFQTLDNDRKKMLNLVTFDEFKKASRL